MILQLVYSPSAIWCKFLGGSTNTWLPSNIRRTRGYRKKNY